MREGDKVIEYYCLKTLVSMSSLLSTTTAPWRQYVTVPA